MTVALDQGISDLAEAIANDINVLEGYIGDLDLLETIDKDSLVDAINEALSSGGSGGSVAWGDITGKPVVIAAGADAATARAAIGAVTASDISAAVAALVGGAGAAYDTLVEIQGLLESNDGAMSALTTAVNNRVRYDAAQSLTDPQKSQARTNIGAYGVTEIGNPDTDFVAVYNTARGV